jgi:hypothetical protein
MCLRLAPLRLSRAETRHEHQQYCGTARATLPTPRLSMKEVLEHPWLREPGEELADLPGLECISDPESNRGSAGKCGVYTWTCHHAFHHTMSLTAHCACAPAPLATLAAPAAQKSQHHPLPALVAAAAIGRDAHLMRP